LVYKDRYLLLCAVNTFQLTGKSEATSSRGFGDFNAGQSGAFEAQSSAGVAIVSIPTNFKVPALPAIYG